jgi:phage terminase large subunit-like protein
MYDKNKADRAVGFIQCLKHTNGIWAGVPFKLLPWEEKIIRDVFGTVKEDGYRQYQTAYIEIPKKNGKTEIAAAVALYLLCADDEQGAEIYGCAADRQQAAIVFNVAAEMVRMNPDLSRVCKIVDSMKRIIYLPTKSFYQVLSAEAYTKHGLNVHGVVFDELHAQPNRELYDVMTKGSGDARMQPLFFFITTAGDDPDRKSICWEVHKKAIAILRGEIVDPTFYPVVYGVGEEEDWEDEANWAKANPSLGHNLRIETFRKWYADAKENPADERSFRQLRLNQWVKDKVSKWISLSVWDDSAGIVVEEKLEGRQCYGGLDLSTKLDISAYLLLFPPADEEKDWYIIPRFWVPEDNLRARVKRDLVPYDVWAKNGFLKPTQGNVIDERVIQQDILRLKNRFDILETGYDPWNAFRMALELTDAGLVMAEVRQGFKTMSPAMKMLEVLLLQGTLKHGGNPVLRWMFGNLEVKTDENENIRPVKGKAIERIDGIIALINALDRAIRHQKEEDSPGIIVL